jgi:hypothetical protein
MSSLQACKTSCSSFVVTSFEEFSSFLVSQRSQLSDSVRSLSWRASQNIRILLTALVRDIDENVQEGDFADELIDVLINIQKIWYLCEIFLLNPTKLLSLELARWLKEAGNQIYLDEIYESIQYMERPELYDGKALSHQGQGGIGYWNFAYKLAMQGSLSDLWSLLSLHSDFSRLENSGNQANRNSIFGMNEVSALKEIILSHPYVSMLDSTESLFDDSSLEVASNQIASELRAWKEKVKQFRQPNNELTGRIPQLVKVIEILSGEKSVLINYCDGDWMSLTLAELLYTYAPPLSRVNLRKIVEESMSSTLMETETNLELFQNNKNTMQSIIAGEVGPAVQYMYECRRRVPLTYEVLPECGILFLTITAYICYFLVEGGGISDLKVPLQEERSTSYIEEVLVDLITELHIHRYPIQILLGFINICPTLKYELSLSILPRIEVFTDQDASVLVDILREQSKMAEEEEELVDIQEQLIQEANTILIARGNWWMHHFPISDKSDTDTDIGIQGYRSLSTALNFFYHAGDLSKCHAVIDTIMMRLINAVTNCKLFFPKLRKVEIYAITPMSITISKSTKNTEDTESNWRAIPSESLRNEKEVNDHASHLMMLALEDAEQAIKLLSADNSKFPQLKSNYQTSYITAYVSAIRKFIDPILKQDDNEDRYNYPLHPDSASVKWAATLLGKMVLQKELPMRYSIHVLELITWLNQCYCMSHMDEVSMEMREKNFFRKDIPEDIPECPEQGYKKYSDTQCAFRKREVYSLLTELEALLSSRDVDRLKMDITNEELKALRMNFGKMLSDACILENAEIGRSMNERTKTNISSSLNHASKVEFERKQHSKLLNPIEMLSGVTY